jgi:hypothetical protein
MQFNYDTISDVILHIRYTAREGGELLRGEAIKHVKELMSEARAMGSVRLFSMRHDFPTEWAKFKSHTPPQGHRYEMAFTLKPEHYPIWSMGKLNEITRLEVLAHSVQPDIPAELEIFDKVEDIDGTEPKKDKLPKDDSLGELFYGNVQNTLALPLSPVGELKWYLKDREIDDMWIMVTWTRK